MLTISHLAQAGREGEAALSYRAWDERSQQVKTLLQKTFTEVVSRGACQAFRRTIIVYKGNKDCLQARVEPWRGLGEDGGEDVGGGIQVGQGLHRLWWLWESQEGGEIVCHPLFTWEVDCVQTFASWFCFPGFREILYYPLADCSAVSFRFVYFHNK